MKKGQQIRNVSDESALGGSITVGAAYTLTLDATEQDVFFQDDEGYSRMRPRRKYALVRPEDDKVLVFLKERAKEFQTSIPRSYERTKYDVVLDLLRDHYGLYVKVTPQVEFLPING